jgi:hypothetical protein
MLSDEQKRGKYTTVYNPQELAVLTSSNLCHSYSARLSCQSDHYI